MTDKHTEKTPYDTEIEFDPNLEVGKIVEDQAGVFGEKEITKTWKLENGEPVGDPETSEKIIKDPTTRKLRVGTKCVCEDPTDPANPSDPTQPGDNPGETTPGTTPSDKVTTPSTEGSKSAKSGVQSGSSLARTGVSVEGTLAAAAALLLAGAGLTAMRRRNSQR